MWDVFSHDFLPWPTLMLFMLVSYLDNRPVSYSSGWTGSSMEWRLMRAN